MSGYEVLQRLTTDEALREIPVVHDIGARRKGQCRALHRIGRGGTICQSPSTRCCCGARIGACLEKEAVYAIAKPCICGSLAEWNQKLEQRVKEQVALLDSSSGGSSVFFFPTARGTHRGRVGRTIRWQPTAAT